MFHVKCFEPHTYIIKGFDAFQMYLLLLLLEVVAVGGGGVTACVMGAGVSGVSV